MHGTSNGDARGAVPNAASSAFDSGADHRNARELDRSELDGPNTKGTGPSDAGCLNAFQRADPMIDSDVDRRLQSILERTSDFRGDERKRTRRGGFRGNPPAAASQSHRPDGEERCLHKRTVDGAYLSSKNLVNVPVKRTLHQCLHTDQPYAAKQNREIPTSLSSSAGYWQEKAQLPYVGQFSTSETGIYEELRKRNETEISRITEVDRWLRVRLCDGITGYFEDSSSE